MDKNTYTHVQQQQQQKIQCKGLKIQCKGVIVT